MQACMLLEGLSTGQAKLGVSTRHTKRAARSGPVMQTASAQQHEEPASAPEPVSSGHDAQAAPAERTASMPEQRGAGACACAQSQQAADQHQRTRTDAEQAAGSACCASGPAAQAGAQLQAGATAVDVGQPWRAALA